MVQHMAKGSVVSALINDPFNPHVSKLISGPSDWERFRWASGDHVVIRHTSDATWPNTNEHGFPEGYGCAIGAERYLSAYPRLYPDPTQILPKRWIWMYENPNLVRGEKGCLYK